MMRRRTNPAPQPAPWLTGKRITMRPLREQDFEQWQEVRLANEDWLLKWEPLRPGNAPDPVRERSAFLVRCDARRRDRQAGAGFSFGVFVDGMFAGEMNLSSIHRGAHQNAGYTPEALVALMQFGFDELNLHRLQISIIPRNAASRRVVEKVGVRAEGIAERYLQINGVWEDHIRFAMTSEEWAVRKADLVPTWLTP